jgi:hypothetical protein
VKKIAQNVAQYMFDKIDAYVNLIENASSQKMWATSATLKKTFKVNNHSLVEHSPNLVTLFPV